MAVSYTFSELPLPLGGFTDCVALAVNSGGVVAGCSGGSWTPAVRWSPGATILDLPPAPEGVGSYATAVNDSGDVVGYYGGPTRPFFWSNGQAQDLSVIVGEYTHANDINNSGVVVGGMWVAPGTPFVYESQGGAVTWLDPLPGHTTSSADAINDDGHVVGISSINVEDNRLYIYRDGAPEDLGPASLVADVNGSDVITGEYQPVPGGNGAAFRLDASASPLVFEPLLGPGWTWSGGHGIDDAGVVVGSAVVDGEARGFVDFPVGHSDAGWHDLEDVVENPPPWPLEFATDIASAGGFIVGWSETQDGKRGWRLVPTDPMAFLEQKLGEFVEEWMTLIGGVEKGGGGIGIPFGGGKPIPIPPHDPGWARRWKLLSPAERDILVGYAVRNVGSLLANRERGEVLRRAAADVIKDAMEEMARKG